MRDSTSERERRKHRTRPCWSRSKSNQAKQKEKEQNSEHLSVNPKTGNQFRKSIKPNAGSLKRSTKLSSI